MITGNEDHSITLAQAATMTKNFRDTITAGAIIAHAFNKSAVQSLLDQAGCVGVRFYYGLDSSVPQIIGVGVNSSGNDLYNGILIERTIKCPQDCSSANPLNSDVTV